MADSEVKPTKGRAVSDVTGAILLMSLGAGCALWLLAQPRAVEPRILPSLELPAAAVKKVMQSDAKAAAAVPQTEAARSLDRLFLKHGSAEREVLEGSDSFNRRRDAMRAAHARVLKESGQQALDAMRSAAVERMEQALDMRLEESLVPAVMGGFADLLVYNRAVRDGVELAPQFVLRTLYKSRWNLLHGTAAVDGFTAVERHAYFGWLALHSGRLSPEDRLDALEAYNKAGGHNAQEAAGVVLYRSGFFAEAAQALQGAYQMRPSLRLRNFVLAAQARTEGHN